jgi:hypothetical protein
LDWPFSISGTQTTDEVIFICLDGPLCCIDAMVSWFDKLPPAILCGEVPLDRLGCLIICHIKGGFVAFRSELGENCLKTFYDSLIRLTLYGLGKDVINVVIVGNKVCLVSIERSGREGARSIGI